MKNATSKDSNAGRWLYGAGIAGMGLLGFFAPSEAIVWGVLGYISGSAVILGMGMMP